VASTVMVWVRTLILELSLIERTFRNAQLLVASD